MALRGGLANTGAGRRALKHRGWVRAFGLVLLGRAFRGSSLGSCFLVVLFVVRALGRSLGSFFCSCFWGLVCVFFRCFKILRGVCGKVRGF